MNKSVYLDEHTKKLLNKIRNELISETIYKTDINDSYIIRVAIRFYYHNKIKK